MLESYQWQCRLAVWSAGLVMVMLMVAACGGTPTPGVEQVFPVETEGAVAAEAQETAIDEPTDEPTAEAEVAQTEKAATAEPTEEVAANETPLDAGTTSGAVCQTVNVPENNLVPMVSEADWTKGPADAPVTLVEYGDFQ